jgi:hypothetical protein
MLIEFVVDEDDVVVLSAQAGADGPAFGAWPVPLTRQWLAERMAQLVQPSVLRDAAQWKDSAGALVMLLPDAFVERLERAQSVVIVPDGVLWRLPFEALPLKGGYLGETRDVSYAGSVAALAASWNTAPSPSANGGRLEGATAPSLVAVAAPDVAPEVRDLALLTAPGWTLRPADGAEDEARRAAALYAGQEITVPAATLLSGKSETEPHGSLRKSGMSRLRDRDPSVRHSSHLQ